MKTQNVTKLKNSNCDKTKKKFNGDKTKKTQFITNIKVKLCQESKTLILTKLTNINWDKTQKIKMRQNSNFDKTKKLKL